MNRDLDTVYQALVGAFNGVELSTGDVLTAEGHVTTLDTVARKQLPYLAFGTGSMDLSEWGPEDFTDEVRWTIPAQLVVQGPVDDGGAAMRSVITDMLLHARKMRGLPHDADGNLVDSEADEFVKRYKAGEIELWADRKGPHIASVRVDGPFDSGRYIAQLTFRLAFLMNLDPRELVRAQVAVLGMRPFDVARSDIDVSVPVEVQMPRFADTDRTATGRFSEPATLISNNGVPAYSADYTGRGIVGARPSEIVREIKVTPPTVSVAALATTQLAALVYYLDGVSLHITSAASWSSSDDTKATVSSTGLVTGVAAGTATITASYAGATATCVVTVT